METDFISDEVPIPGKPVISGVNRSKWYNSGRNKNELPVFLVRESGNWNDGVYRQFFPFKSHGKYFVGNVGKPTDLPVLWTRCVNY